MTSLKSNQNNANIRINNHTIKYPNKQNLIVKNSFINIARLIKKVNFDLVLLNSYND